MAKADTLYLVSWFKTYPKWSRKDFTLFPCATTLSRFIITIQPPNRSFLISIHNFVWFFFPVICGYICAYSEVFETDFNGAAPPTVVLFIAKKVVWDANWDTSKQERDCADVLRAETVSLNGFGVVVGEAVAGAPAVVRESEVASDILVPAPAESEKPQSPNCIDAMAETPAVRPLAPSENAGDSDRFTLSFIGMGMESIGWLAMQLATEYFR